MTTRPVPEPATPEPATPEPATPEPRSRAQRRRDSERRLADDVDVWVASAAPDGTPHLVPLSFDWDGDALWLATPLGSPTGRNLAASRSVRLALGHTRDVTMIEGDVEVVDIGARPSEDGDRFVARTGFDPRTLSGYAWFRVVPRRMQAWREVDEMAGRDLVRDGAWLAATAHPPATSGADEPDRSTQR